LVRRIVSRVERYDPAEVEQLLKLAARITGRAGGSSKSPVKVSASRVNGKKGGRPPKAKGQAK